MTTAPTESDTDLKAPLNLSSPLCADRAEIRKRVAQRLQWACVRFPMTIAADDDKALVVAELVLRDIEGRKD